MIDRGKVIEGLEAMREFFGFGLPSQSPVFEAYQSILTDAIVLLKEQEKLVDVDALREKLGLAKDCAKCKQNTRWCQYDSHFSLMDFCERLDMAIEELTKTTS